MPDLLSQIPASFNYWAVVGLMTCGLYIIFATSNYVKKIIGLNIFQTSAFILYISIGKVKGATAPILTESHQLYSNPLTHVLILTAIVVGVATTAVGLALVIRIRAKFGTIDDIEAHEAAQSERD